MWIFGSRNFPTVWIISVENRIFTEDRWMFAGLLLLQMKLWTIKSPLSFGSYHDPYSDSGSSLAEVCAKCVLLVLLFFIRDYNDVKCDIYTQCVSCAYENASCIIHSEVVLSRLALLRARCLLSGFLHWCIHLTNLARSRLMITANGAKAISNITNPM